jgi:hypothetical protein
MRRLRGWAAHASFVIAVIAAALAPLFHRVDDSAIAANGAFPGWPGQYEGRTLTEMPLMQRELAFVRDFPGRVGRFSDGRREVIIRWVGAPTRRLHSAADCLRGIGYAITPLPARRDAAGAAMGCFRATHGGDDITVCEVVRDEAGENWPDVSAWYWSAMLGESRAPWWSFVVAESTADRK